MQPLEVLVMVNVYKPADVTSAFRFVDIPEIVPLTVLHCALYVPVVVFPCKVIDGTVQVIIEGGTMDTFAGALPSATFIVRLLMHPVVGWVAVSEYIPGASTIGAAMVDVVIFPGPVHNNVEFTGAMLLVMVDVDCVHVMAAETTGKLITGAVKSCNTFVVCAFVHPVMGCVTVRV